MTTWKPTLAATWPVEQKEFDSAPFPLWASPKIDGWRVTIQNGVALTRNGLPVVNPTVQAMLGWKLLEGFDGELGFGRPNSPEFYQLAKRYLPRQEHLPTELAEQLRFNVFDQYDPTEPDSTFVFRNRVIGNMFREHVRVFKQNGVMKVPQAHILDAKHLTLYEAQMLNLGYEGIMLRKGDAGRYMHKRSTLREFNLVKVKRFEHGEARILEPHYLEHNLNEERTSGNRRSSKKSGIEVDKSMVGSVTVQDTLTGTKFSLNVPTAVLRSKTMSWWKARAGETIRYKYQLIGTDLGGAPRQPTAGFEEL